MKITTSAYIHTASLWFYPYCGTGVTIKDGKSGVREKDLGSP